MSGRHGKAVLDALQFVLSQEDRTKAGAQVGTDGRAHTGGQCHGDRLQQEIEHGEGVMGDAAMTLALIAG